MAARRSAIRSAPRTPGSPTRTGREHNPGARSVSIRATRGARRTPDSRGDSAHSGLPVARGSDTIHIAGIDDVWFSHDLHGALKDIPLEEYKILLSHSPDIMSAVNKKMRIDLTICGHTYGGQLAIPHLTHHFLPIDNPARYIDGLVKEDHGYTYVNRGIGTLVFPFRLGAPPEITSFRLFNAKHQPPRNSAAAT